MMKIAIALCVALLLAGCGRQYQRPATFDDIVRRAAIRTEGVAVSAPCEFIVYRWHDSLWIIYAGIPLQIETPRVSCDLS